MTILAIAVNKSHTELLRLVDEAAPACWSRRAVVTSWGSLAWAGDGVTDCGRWLVLGHPSADPWGWPGRPLGASELQDRLNDFGPESMRTASGPYLALDLMTGQVLRATNGLVPFFLSDPAGSATGSTSLSLATQLAEPGILPRSVPIRRTGQDRKARTALKGSLVRRELLEHRPHGILDADVLVPQAHDPFWGNGPKAAIRLHEVRNVEAQAQWWTARLSGRWLHAPALERPVIDRLLEAGS